MDCSQTGGTPERSRAFSDALGSSPSTDREPRINRWQSLRPHSPWRMDSAPLLPKSPPPHAETAPRRVRHLWQRDRARESNDVRPANPVGSTPLNRRSAGTASTAPPQARHSNKRSWSPTRSRALRAATAQSYRGRDRISARLASADGIGAGVEPEGLMSAHSVSRQTPDAPVNNVEQNVKASPAITGASPPNSTLLSTQH